MEDKKLQYLKYFVKETKSINYNINQSSLNSSEEYNEILSCKEIKSNRKFIKFKNKINPNVKFNHGNVQDINLLMKTITNENYNVTQTLFSLYKFDINATDMFKWTPLMVACHKGDIDIVKLLIDKGANLNVKDHKGNSSMSIAKQRGHNDIVRLLKYKIQENIDNGRINLNKNIELRDSLNNSSESFPFQSNDLNSSASNQNNSIIHISNPDGQNKTIEETNKFLKIKIDKTHFESLKEKLNDLNPTKVSPVTEIITDEKNQSNIILPSCSYMDKTNNIETIKETEPEIICLSDSDNEDDSTIFCELCNLNILNKNKKEHYLSTIHQFYKQLNYKNQLSIPINYKISENNKGFQLLLKNGWNKNTGLGKNKSGIKIPIKNNKIKKNKEGIGIKSYNNKKLYQIKPEDNINFNFKLKNELDKKIELSFRNEFK